MALETEIKVKIASIVGIRTDQINCDGIEFTDDSATISLNIRSVFFPDAVENEIAREAFNKFNNKYTYDFSCNCFIDCEDEIDRIYFKQLIVKNHGLDKGIHDLRINDKTKQPYIYIAGGRTNSEIDLSKYREILYIITKLPIIGEHEGILGWTELLNCFGSFVVYFDSSCQICDSLCEYGIFEYRPNTFALTWESSPDFNMFFPKTEIPVEAIRSYIGSLENSDNPELAFFQLYRTFEVLFAFILKDKISTSDIREILNIISNDTKKELNLLKFVIEKSGYSFTSFTLGDLERLVDRRYWVKKSYADLLSKTRGMMPSDMVPDDVRSHAIYIVRCAIVHSKLDSESAVLLPPYTLHEVNALTHLVEDVRGILKCLLF